MSKGQVSKLRGVATVIGGIGVSIAIGCATNPATGQKELALVSEGQEIAMGAQNDSAIVQEMGVVPNDALQSYLRGIGAKLAQISERPQLSWTFRVVEDPVVNAFAVPGGYIYITRGIMAHLNNEAQLASVVGHEIGHVTARHTVSQISKAQVAQLGLGLGMIFSPAVRQLGDVASAGLSVLFLKFSRDDETQADDLGLRYVVKAGYDPREMPGVYRELARISATAGGGKTPAWLSTHPDPGNREQTIQQAIAAMNQSWEGRTVAEEQYLSRLNGMMYGPNPREGFFRESLFLHPDLAFQIQFPAGWQTMNQKQAVMAMSPEQDALMEVSIVPQKSLDAAAQAFFGAQGIVASQPRQTRVGDFEGVVGEFSAQADQNQQIRGIAAFIQYNNNVYRLLGYGPPQGYAKNAGKFQDSFSSFSRVTDREVLGMQPLRLEVVRLPQPMSLAQFNQHYASQIAMDKLALLNQIDDPNAQIPAGRMLKRVVRGG